MGVSAMCVQVCKKPEGDVIPTGAGALSDHMPPDMGTGNQTQVPWRNRKHS